jgi:hypothetical protein
VGDELGGVQLRARRQAPGSKRGTVGYLMYPQGETDTGRLDSLDPTASSTASRSTRSSDPSRT